MKKINENELTMVAGGCPNPYVEPMPAPEPPDGGFFLYGTIFKENRIAVYQD